MDKIGLHFLKQLVAVPAPSGWEHDGLKLAAAHLATCADRLDYDVHGNLHAVINPGAPRRFMLEAHADEIGLMVQYIDDDGFLYMTAIGGVTVPLLAGERIIIQGRNGPVAGVFGVRPPHLMKASEKDKPAASELVDLWVDIGAASRSAALARVDLGSPAVIDAGWLALDGDRVACRGFDNRIGAFVVSETMRRLRGRVPAGLAVHLVLSVQEELGLLGATTAAFAIDPHAGVCVDVGFAADYPGNDKKLVGDVRLGKGPILGFGPTYNPRLRGLLEATAERETIPLQRQVRSRGNGNNAWAIRQTRGGAAAAVVAIPLRYMHSAVEVLSLGDVEQAVNLLTATVAALPPDLDFNPAK